MTSTALVSVKDRFAAVSSALEQKKDAFEMVCAGTGVNPTRAIAIVKQALIRDTKLLECDPRSIVRSVGHALEAGLEIAGPTGEAFIVPFYNNKKGHKEAQMIIGYRGLIKLILQSGRVRNVEARIVHQGDAFDYEEGTNSYIKHKPGDVGGEVTHAYAIAYFPDGGHQFVMMNRERLDAIREKTKSRYQGRIVGPWADDVEEMWKKCPVRNLSKYVELSPAAKTAMGRDGDVSFDMRAPVTNDRADALKAKLGQAQPVTYDADTGEISDADEDWRPPT